MRVSLLGPLEITGHDGELVDLRGRKPRILLAVLACHANRPVPTEVLVEALWGPDPPQQVGVSLRVYLHQLRKALGSDRIARRAEGFVLRLEPDELDLERFRSLGAQGRAAVRAQQWERAHELLTTALSVWRGSALVGLEAVSVLTADATGLEQLRLQTLEQRFEVELELGWHDTVVAELRALIDHHPLRETFRGQLMRALVGEGRDAEAVAVFEATRRVLADELGLDPSPWLRELHLSILREDPALRRADRRVPRTVPRQLPARTAGFTGRSAALDQLDALHSADAGDAMRIALISGIGGVGKTTLAVHWAHTVAERFPDGQLYLDLSGFDPIRPPVEPAAALGTLLVALGVPVRQLPGSLVDRESLYRSMLADRRVLAVLDNARDAAQVRPLLPGGPGCLVVVTSRNQLTGLVAAGASALVLDPFRATEAYELLEHRLGSARVAAEPVAVGQILDRCGGLPLALSVVAARAAVLRGSSLAALADELHHTRRVLDGFTGDDATTDPRVVFFCSYRNLGAGAARMFRLLSLHPGPDITVRAAASLAGIALDAARAALQQLRVTSLLVEASPGRYRCHDLVREYARELTETTDPVAEREAAMRRLLDHLLHTAYPAALLIDPHQMGTSVDPAAPGVTPDQVETRQQALAWFDLERPVILAAVQHARKDYPSQAWQLACSSVVYLERSGHWHDKLDVLSVARDAARVTGQRAVEARTLRSLGRTLGRLCRYEEAYSSLRVAVAIYRDIGDVHGMAFTCGAFGEALERAGRYSEALEMDQEAYELYRQAGSVIGQARSLGGIASVQALLGRYEETIATCRLALEQFELAEDLNGIAGVSDTLGLAFQHLGRYDEAIACFQHALDTMRESGERFYVALVHSHLADAHRATGDTATARTNLEAALAIFSELGAHEAAGVKEQLAMLDPSDGSAVGSVRRWSR